MAFASARLISMRSLARGLAQGPGAAVRESFEQKTLKEVTQKLRLDQASEPADWDDNVEAKGDSAPGDEVGGPRGLEPTRFGDWERKGRCTDF
jgi:hypothetical protein